MSRSYQYDRAGNITQITSDLGATQYSYDALGRLTQAKPDTALQTLGLPQEQYAYDSVHNRTSSAHQPGAWSYNADNQLTQYPAQQNGQTLVTQVQYTPQGHTQKETNSQSTKNYRYNAAERLVRYEEADSAGAVQASYRYDPFGRRITKTVAKGSATQTTYYIYGDSGLLAEMNEQGQMQTAYGWNPQAQDAGLWGTAPVWQAQVGGNGLSSSATAYHYLHTDHLETPVLGTDKSGRQTWKAASEAFGNTWVDTSSAITMNLRFAGQYFDVESGLHQNYFRDYRPGVGRYLERDPIGLSGGINSFAYVGGDPVNFSDPDGLQARPPRGGGATQPMFPPIGPTIRPSGPYSIPTQGTNPRYYNYTGGSQGRNTDGRGNARDIFREMTGGRATESLPGGNGVWTELPNGTRVNYRETPIGPRIDIYPPRPGSPETLHFPGGPIGGVCLP